VRVRFERQRSGGVSVWKEPEPLKQYVIAADAAGGGEHGDFAAACVIEAETCDLVATFRSKIDPHRFGPLAARLAWYYGEALLAFETYPSAHGYTAALEAQHYGYKRLYRRHREDIGFRQIGDILGFHTNSTTKPQLIDRIKKALEEGCKIPSRDLMLEIKSKSWDETGDLSDRGHDDLLMAYAIALRVRDQAYTRGLLREKAPELNSWEDRYWAARRQRFDRAQPRMRRAFNGL